MNILGSFRDKSRFVGAIVVFVIFLGFIYQSGVLSISMIISRLYGNKVGVVFDKKLYLEEYLNVYSILRNKFKDSEKQKELKDLAWYMYVHNEILHKQTSSLGIDLSNLEIVDIVQGNNVSSILKDSGVFVDEATNKFSKKKLRRYLESLSNQSIEEQEAWIRFERNMIEKRKSDKIDNLLQNSIYINGYEKRAISELMKKRYKFNCVFIPFDVIKSEFESKKIDENSFRNDPDVEKKVKDYYLSNLKYYKADSAIKIKYGVISYQPSENDTIQFNQELSNISQSFANTNDDDSFAISNSDTKLDNYNVDLKEVDLVEMGLESSAIESINIGDVLSTKMGTALFGSTVKIYKIKEVNNIEGKKNFRSIVLERVFLPSKESKLKALLDAKDILKKNKNNQELVNACNDIGVSIGEFSLVNGKPYGEFNMKELNEANLAVLVSNVFSGVNDPIELEKGVLLSVIEEKIENSNLSINFVRNDIVKELYCLDLATYAASVFEKQFRESELQDITNCNLMRGQQLFTEQFANFESCETNQILSRPCVLGTLINMRLGDIKFVSDIKGVYLINLTEVIDIDDDTLNVILNIKETDEKSINYHSLKQGVLEIAQVKDFRYKYNI